MNVNEKLNDINAFVSYVKTCKTAMRSALIGQNQVVPEDASLDTFAAHIAAIEGGGSSTVFTVQYKDHDGTILKSQQVLPGGAVLKPTDPSREGWNFTGWDGDSDNVQSDLTITAQYEYAPNIVVFVDYKGKIISTQNIPTGEDAVPPTVDWGNVILDSWGDYSNIQSSRVVLPTFHTLNNKTYLRITLSESTGLSPTFYFWVKDSGNMQITFGDGETGASYLPGAQSLTHTYPTYGTYDVELSGSAYLGQAPSNIPSNWKALLENSYGPAIIKANCDTQAVTNAACFRNCVNLDDASFTGWSSTEQFKDCSSLESVIVPSTLIYSSCFENCTNLNTVIVKRNDIIIGLENINAFSNTHSDLKIYVPDNLVESYKVADVWSVIAHIIHPLTDLTIYGN